MKIRADMITVFVVRPTAKGSHEFLQLRRAPGEYLPGTWQTVRGGIDPDETAVDAALRELREETGLRPVEFYRLGTVETFFIPKHDTVWMAPAFCAIVAPDARVTPNGENDDSRWVPRDAMLDTVLWASERTVLPHLFRDILDDGPAKTLLRV
jgi:dATP pyrophosphohydrolase